MWGRLSWVGERRLNDRSEQGAVNYVRTLSKSRDGLAEEQTLDLDDSLARILALEQPDKRFRHILESLDDVLSILELAFANPARHLDHRSAPARRVIADQ